MDTPGQGQLHLMRGVCNSNVLYCRQQLLISLTHFFLAHGHRIDQGENVIQLRLFFSVQLDTAILADQINREIIPENAKFYS